MRGVSLPGGVLPARGGVLPARGVSLPGGGGFSLPETPPTVDRITDACKNIALVQLKESDFECEMEAFVYTDHRMYFNP